MCHYYFGRFKQANGLLVRSDTRVYLHDRPDSDPDRRDAVAAVIAKNPGTASDASEGKWGPISPDDMLWKIRTRFRSGYARAERAIATSDFVYVLILFYVREPKLNAAKRLIGASILHDEGEANLPALVWIGWGPRDSTLDPLKERFRNKELIRPFFAARSGTIWSVHERMPERGECAWHPGVAKADPVVEHLKSALFVAR